MSDDYVSVIDLKPFMKNLNILLIILSRLEEHEQTNETFCFSMQQMQQDLYIYRVRMKLENI